MKSRISDKSRLRRGRGEGSFENYTPFLFVTDFSSRGMRWKIPGVKIDRWHHLLSLGELRTFYMLESSPHVTDIREQFPLLPLQETQEIARELNIRHPQYGGIPTIMTTDFLVSMDDRKEAVSFKLESDLSIRNLQKRQIEMIYWKRRDASFRPVTEKDISIVAAKNWERIRMYDERPLVSVSDKEFISFLKEGKNLYGGVMSEIRHLSKLLKVSVADLHHLYLYLIFKGKIQIDYKEGEAIQLTLNQLRYG